MSSAKLAFAILVAVATFTGQALATPVTLGFGDNAN